MEPDSGVVRPSGVRRSFLALLLALLALTLLPAGWPASASCAGPSVDAPRVLVRDETIQVRGERFVDGCRDSMSCPAFGCGECEYDDPPPVPTPDVTLRLTQRGRTWDLGTADADRRGRVRWTFTVPDDVRPGPARLSWDDEQSVPVRVGPTAG
jgi:hypothetical protein